MELSQEEIVFENTYISHLTGWYKEYDYKSFGNLMHWVYVYFGLNIADSSIFGDGEVKHHGILIATYVFDEDLKMPIFYDVDDNYSFGAYKQEMYLKGIKNGLLDKVNTKYVTE